MLQFTKYNYNDVPGGHTLGHCLSAVHATNIQYTVTTAQSPGEKKTYATHLAALECLYAFAPLVKFTGYLAKEVRRVAQEARTRRVAEELWGRSRARTAT
jgi:hypothetical protein